MSYQPEGLSAEAQSASQEEVLRGDVFNNLDFIILCESFSLISRKLFWQSGSGFFVVLSCVQCSTCRRQQPRRTDPDLERRQKLTSRLCSRWWYSLVERAVRMNPLHKLVWTYCRTAVVQNLVTAGNLIELAVGMTNSMEQNLSSVTNSCSARQKIPHLIWNAKVHYLVYYSLPHSVMSRRNPVCILISYYVKIRFSIILSSTSRSSKWCFPFRWAKKEICMYFSSLPFPLHDLPISSLFIWSNNIGEDYILWTLLCNIFSVLLFPPS
jgi:hypothetical protein